MLFKVFNEKIPFFRAPVDKETRSPKTTAKLKQRVCFILFKRYFGWPDQLS